MAGRNGVTAATMVQAGFTGVDDVFIGPRNFFFTYADKAKPEALTDGLGTRYEITVRATNTDSGQQSSTHAWTLTVSPSRGVSEVAPGVWTRFN